MSFYKFSKLVFSKLFKKPKNTNRITLYILFAQSCHKVQKSRKSGFFLTFLPVLFERALLARLEKNRFLKPHYMIDPAEFEKRRSLLNLFFWMKAAGPIEEIDFCKMTFQKVEKVCFRKCPKLRSFFVHFWYFMKKLKFEKTVRTRCKIGKSRFPTNAGKG